MTKKEKIAWAMAKYLDRSESARSEYIEKQYSDERCEHCDSEMETEKLVLNSQQIEDLYQAYQLAKKLDKGK